MTELRAGMDIDEGHASRMFTGSVRHRSSRVRPEASLSVDPASLQARLPICVGPQRTSRLLCLRGLREALLGRSCSKIRVIRALGSS
jgi:hypothetical protein